VQNIFRFRKLNFISFHFTFFDAHISIKIVLFSFTLLCSVYLGERFLRLLVFPFIPGYWKGIGNGPGRCPGPAPGPEYPPALACTVPTDVGGGIPGGGGGKGGAGRIGEAPLRYP